MSFPCWQLVSVRAGVMGAKLKMSCDQKNLGFFSCGPLGSLKA